MIFEKETMEQKWCLWEQMKCLDRRKKGGKGTFLAWITKMLWEFWNVFQFMGCNRSKVVVKPL